MTGVEPKFNEAGYDADMQDYGSASRTHYDDPNDIYPDGGELEEEPPQQMPVVKQTLSLAAEAFARQQDIARFDDHGSEELHCLP